MSKCDSFWGKFLGHKFIDMGVVYWENRNKDTMIWKYDHTICSRCKIETKKEDKDIPPNKSMYVNGLM